MAHGSSRRDPDDLRGDRGESYRSAPSRQSRSRSAPPGPGRGPDPGGQPGRPPARERWRRQSGPAKAGYILASLLAVVMVAAGLGGYAVYQQLSGNLTKVNVGDWGRTTYGSRTSWCSARGPAWAAGQLRLRRSPWREQLGQPAADPPGSHAHSRDRALDPAGHVRLRAGLQGAGVYRHRHLASPAVPAGRDYRRRAEHRRPNLCGADGRGPDGRQTRPLRGVQPTPPQNGGQLGGVECAFRRVSYGRPTNVGLSPGKHLLNYPGAAIAVRHGVSGVADMRRRPADRAPAGVPLRGAEVNSTGLLSGHPSALRIAQHRHPGCDGRQGLGWRRRSADGRITGAPQIQEHDTDHDAVGDRHLRLPALTGTRWWWTAGRCAVPDDPGPTRRGMAGSHAANASVRVHVLNGAGRTSLLPIPRPACQQADV